MGRLSRWSKSEIANEITRMHLGGEELNYTAVERNYLALLRAGCRHFGSWREAIEFAGLDYDEIRKYRSWSEERVVERIQELQGSEADLSWRHVCEKLDPPLAAAATRAGRFGSWRAALEAAGLDYDEIRRYRDWDDQSVLREVREMRAAGEPLNSRIVQENVTDLFHAARRRFERWDNVLEAAGIDAEDVRKRPRVPA